MRTVVRAWISVAVLGLFSAWFYVRYVPLVPGYQAVLAPALLLVAVPAARDFRGGLIVFAAAFPLFNGVPYLFGLDEAVPHAPVGAVLFLAFFLGRLIGRGLGRDVRPNVPPGRPLLLLTAWVAVSGAVAFLRYGDFFPFTGPRLNEITVNAAGVTAGGARMSVVFAVLGFAAGIWMFREFRRAADDPRFAARLLAVLAASFLVSLTAGLGQALAHRMFGTTDFWRYLKQVNGTYQDPNVLAAFIAGFLPLLAALSIEARGARRILFLTAVSAGLVLMPLSGSRSGPVALAAAALVFLGGAFRRMGAAARRRVLAAALGLVLLFAAWNLFVVPRSALSARLTWSLDQLRGEGSGPGFFNLRLLLWSAGLRMFRENPLTGLGPGAFVVEFPSYNVEAGRPAFYSDTALNLPIQIAAEQGLLGLLLAGLVGAGLLRGIGRAIRGREGGGWVPLGAAAGLVALAANFLFHTYAANFEVQFLFWLLASRLGTSAWERRKETVGPRGVWDKIGAAAVLAGAFLFLALSLGRLSPAARAERFGWPRTFGFQDVEMDPLAGPFRWTGPRAGFTVPAGGTARAIDLRALNPDLETRPLRVRILLADRFFRPLAAAGEAVLRTRDWMRLVVPLPAGSAGETHLLVEPDRTWRPADFVSGGDRRVLGVSVRDPYFTGGLVPGIPLGGRRAVLY